MNIGYVIAINALYGTTLTASKALVGLAAPIMIIGIRMTTAGSLMLILRSIAAGRLFKVSKELWPYILQIAIFNIYIPYVLRYWSLQYISVSKSSLFFNLTPLISYIIAYFMGLQKQSARKWLGITISFVGFLPMISDNPASESAGGYLFGFISKPELAMFSAIVSLSYSWIIMQKAVKQFPASPLTINGISMLIGGVLALITSYFFTTDTTISNPWQFVGLLSFVIIVTNFICYNAQAVLLKHFSTTIIALASLSAPLFATLTGALFLGEAITWRFLLSTAMLAVGIFIFYQAEYTTSHQKK
jgi:drug/metabolite transporter (DMT)-like permease